MRYLMLEESFKLIQKKKIKALRFETDQPDVKDRPGSYKQFFPLDW